MAKPPKNSESEEVDLEGAEGGDADGGNSALMWLRLLAAHTSITNVSGLS